jgi:Uma2 family endonuclease
MGISTPVKPVSIEEYLSNPAYEHSEYVNGEVVPLNAGTKSHSRIQGKCFRKLDEYFDSHPGAYAGPDMVIEIKSPEDKTVSCSTN